jgi:hypothetical protein
VVDIQENLEEKNDNTKQKKQKEEGANKLRESADGM